LTMKRIALALFFLMTENVWAEPVRADIPKSDCIHLLAESADYVPGISVTGQEVVSADLNSGINMPLPDLENVTLPVYLNLKRDFPFLSSDFESGFLPVAQVDFQDGQVFVNGMLVFEDGVKALKKACKKSLEKEKMDKNNLTPVQ